MARNNIRRVPPPTAYFGTIDVTVEPSDDALFFTSINDAIDYLLNLPEDIHPLNGIPWAIRLHPGVYQERFDLPVNTGLFGVSPVGAIIVGGSDVQTDDSVIGVQNGTISNIVIQPSGVTGTPETILWIKDSKTLYTKRDSDWSLSLNTRQLIITPQGQSQETFIFTATEVDAATVAAFINTNGVNINAKVEHNQVSIYGVNGGAGQILTVDKSGTANIVFGFSQTIDQTTVQNASDFLVVKEIFLVGSSSIDKALFFSDDGGGLYVVDGISTSGSQHGLYFDDNASAIIRSAYSFFHPTAGIEIGQSAIVELEGGRARFNPVNDVSMGVASKLNARAFSYQSISYNGGEIVPVGSRITFEWNYGGVLATGTNVDGMRPVPHNITIESVQVARRLNGSDGSTIIDINKANSGSTPVTLYTTQGNRPTIDYTQGDWVVELAVLPDILNVSKGDHLTMDIDQVEAGAGPAAPADLHVVVTAVVN